MVLLALEFYRAHLMSSSFPDKTCIKCGRSFSWRKKWARTWEEVRYCSASCRRHRINATDRNLEKKILNAISSAPTGSIVLDDLKHTPKEAEPLRQAARRLAVAGHIVMRKNGRTIDPRTLQGSVVVASVCD